MNALETTNNLMTDRLNFQKDVEYDLLKFIKLQIEKVNNETDVKKSVLKKIQDRLENDEDPINDLVLVKLLEILAKQDNEIALGIMGLIKTNKEEKNTNPNPVSNDPDSNFKDSDLTKEDVSNIKNVLELLRKREDIQKSEYSEYSKSY